MNKAIHGLITAFLAVGCWFLWAMLKLTAGFMHRVSDHPPQFTQLCVNLRPVFAVLPILALAYCVYVWVRKADPRHSWVGFFATTMGALVLTMLPTMVAVWLPMVQFIEKAAGK
jgi:hypothetical protein